MSIRIIAFILLMILSNQLFSSQYLAQIEIYNQIPKQHKSSQEIYGMFMEFILDWMNGPIGMGAQELMHRGFDLASPDDPRVAHSWIAIGEDASHELILGGYNINGQYFQRVKSSSSIAGVAQNIVMNSEIINHFYTYARASSETELYVRISENDNTLFFDTLIIRSNDWEKYELDISAFQGHYQVLVELLIPENSEIDLDEVSIVPSDNYMGLRREFKNVFDYWKPGVIRFPGGTFADRTANKLEHQIGPMDQRESPNLVFGVDYERMDFGLDEFLQFCEAENVEPHICVNYENATPQEAANMVEYCNGSVETEFGSLRAANGHPEPYHVKYWEIGNEQWQDPEAYSNGYLLFEKEMRETDPSIEFICDGNNWGEFDFFNSMVSILGEHCDYYGYHPAIWQYPDHPGTVEQRYLIDVGVTSWYFERQLLEIEEWTRDFGLEGKMHQASTEWWSSYGFLSDWLLDTNVKNNSIQSAISNATNIMVYQKYPKQMKFAERTLALGMIDRTFDNNGKRVFIPKTNLHAVHLLSYYSGDDIYNFNIESPTYFFGSDTLWTGKDVNYLEASVSGDEDFYYLAIVNRHPYDDAIVNIDFSDEEELFGPMIIHSINANNYTDFNKPDDPNRIRPIKQKTDLSSQIMLKKHSVNVVQIPRREGLSNREDVLSKSIEYVNGSLIIESDFRGASYYEIYDLNGKRIISNKIFLHEGENRFDLSEVDLQGIYLIKVLLEGRMISRSIMCLDN